MAAQCSSLLLALLQTSGKACKASVWPALGKGCDSPAFSTDPHGNTTVKIKITVLVGAQQRLSAAVANIKPLGKALLTLTLSLSYSPGTSEGA